MKFKPYKHLFIGLALFLSCFSPVMAQQQSAADSTLGNIGNSANNKTVSGQSNLAQGDTAMQNGTSATAPTEVTDDDNRSNGVGNWGWIGLLGLLGLLGLRRPSGGTSDLYKRESNVTTHHGN